MKMKKRHLLTAIICFIAAEAFSQFDWKYLSTYKGVEFYWLCKKELSDQYCSKLKLVNTNSYKVFVDVTPTFTVNSKEYTIKTPRSIIQAGATQGGDYQGLSYYPGEYKTTCPSYVKLDIEVKTEETKPTTPTTNPDNKEKSPVNEKPASNTFDWKFINSANGVGFYWRCSQVSDNKFKSEIKAVNNNNYKVNVSLIPTFTVNGMAFNLSKKDFSINTNSLVAGQPDGLDFNPGNGVTCPSYININYSVTNAETNNPAGQPANNQSNVTNQQNTKSDDNENEYVKGNETNTDNRYSNNTSTNSQSNRSSTDEKNAQITAHNNELLRQKQLSKENYERQLEQSKQIEDLGKDFSNAIDNALYGTPEERQARMKRQAEEDRLEEERIEQRKIDRENKMREEEENRRIAEEKRRIAEENRRMEAEQLQRRNNYYETVIPAFTMPNKYKDANLAEAFFFYVVRTNNNEVFFSGIFPLRKLADDTWPYKSDLDNKLKAEAKASEFKLVGFFPDINNASARQQQLIQTAQEEGFNVDFFTYKYKDYKDGIQNDTQPKPKTGTDFWNK
jgi:hypothetical protein